MESANNMKLRIKVPATSANLGPGFDCIGIALDWWNTIQVETLARGLEIECPDNLPHDKSNAVIQGMIEAFKLAGHKLPPVRVKMNAEVPIASGLGSSSAALVSGILAANALMGDCFSRAQVLSLATHIEGHPDNVTPALLGGLVVAVQEGKLVHAVRIQVPNDLRTVIFIPEYQVLTKRARGILPHDIPRADSIYNSGRTALWIAALYERRYDWLDLATRDRLHQPYRAKLVRGMNELCDAARKAGARGVALSGAGPSIIAFTDHADDDIARAMERAARKAGVEGKTHLVRVSAHGARVTRLK
ncbi:homoserine kinase [Anaerolineae bacterium]|nr:homoserine kinase [Anaerolineae bacterium]